MPKTRNIKGNATLSVAAIVATIAAAEIALHLSGISYPYFTRIDPVTGFSLRPNAAGRQRDEGEAYVQINSEGFRDIERQKEKPKSVLRIAALGDSYVEARQVDLAETFPAILETNLTVTCPSRTTSYEVLNFGVSGFSTIQELLLLREKAWGYSPDIVLLAFTTGNDVSGNSRELSRGAHQPYMKEENGGLVPDFSFRESPLFTSQSTVLAKMAHAIIARSRVAQVLNRIRTRSFADRNRNAADSRTLPQYQGMRSSARLRRAQLGGEPGLDDAIYREPLDPAWLDAWRITEQTLEMMHTEAEQHSATFAVAIVPNGIQVHPDPAVWKAFAEHLGVRDLLEPVRRVEAIGNRHGFPVVSLVEPLRKYAEETQTFLHGFENTEPGSGHWNGEGHRAAARFLSDFLCHNIIPLR